MRVETGSKLFGVELRRRRVGAGLSLDAFARLVHYSKSHLSKVENGVKRPSADLARLCDAVLGCGGVLAALVDESVPGAPAHSPVDASEVLVYEHDRNGGERLATTSRRVLITGGLLSAAGLTTFTEDVPASSATHGSAILSDASPLEVFRSWYGQARALGQRLDARILIPTLASYTRSVSLLAAEYRGADRRRALALVADYAEFTGWMAQEAGDSVSARRWTSEAVRFAEAAGDQGMAVYALVRYALIAMYQDKAEQTVAAARHAGQAKCRPRIRGLAAQREAQGHAMANRRGECLRALERARELLAADPPGTREAVIGSAHVPDHVQAATGWSLYELGDVAEAADILGETVSRIPPHAIRARGRFAARRALALARAGRLSDAIAEADHVLDIQTVLRSGTIGADLYRLERTIQRHWAQPGVVELSLRLHESRQHLARISPDQQG